MYERCGYSINHDPLFSLTQEVKDPVDHTGIYICCFKLLREDVMRNSIECFAEAKHKKSQNSLVAAVVAITKWTDIVLKQNQSDNKELLTTLTDRIALAMNCLHDMNSTRRQSMNQDLHRDYAT